MLKKSALKILRATNFDFSITHHWVKGKKFYLNSSKHKNYWWHGKNREKNEMEAIGYLVRPGFVVIEVGAHIGYLTALFRALIGDNGKLYVFEPGPDNLKYLKKNADENNVILNDMAASDSDEIVSFYLEDLSGQNNSLIEDLEILQDNADNAGFTLTKQAISVQGTRLDTYVSKNGIKPDFIKIDVEGAELRVLNGTLETIRSFRPVVMIEVTQDHETVGAIFSSLEYTMYDERLQKISSATDVQLNIFCVPSEADPIANDLPRSH